MQRVFVTLLVAVSLVVACGGGQPAAQSTSSGPVRIGATVSLTGSYSGIGIKMKNTIDLWQREINGKGGLLGRQVEFLINDDKSDPETAAQFYTKYITEDKVDVIFGTYGAPIIQRVGALAEQYHMLFLEAVGTPESLFQQGFTYMFLTAPMTAEKIDIPYFQWISNLPAAQRPKTAAFITQDTVAPKGQAAGAKSLSESAGVKTVMNDFYAASVVDFGSVATKVASTHADLVFQTGYGPDTIAFTKAFCQTGEKPAFLVTGIAAVSSPSYPSQVDAACANGTSYATWWDPGVKLAASQKFADAYQQQYSQIADWPQANLYSGLQILNDVVSHVKAFDQGAMKRYVLATTFDTVEGPLSFNSNGSPKQSGGVVVQWQDGKKVILWPAQNANGKAIIPRA